MTIIDADRTAIDSLVAPTPFPGSFAVSYLRVSTKEQAEKGGQAEGFSIPARREANQRKADQLGATIVEEFVDAGESARKADRPELMRMIQYVTKYKTNYCIVHKVDRLARNRADDVTIHLALKDAGVTLVSATENIDETPSGMPRTASCRRLPSSTRATWPPRSSRGLSQKAAQGGTVSKAPIGYRNIGVRDEFGREVRTVELDEERAPLIRWAFQRFATGDWSTSQLHHELVARGLTTAPSPRRPSRPIGKSSVHRMLTNPYYKARPLSRRHLRGSPRSTRPERGVGSGADRARHAPVSGGRDADTRALPERFGILRAVRIAVDRVQREERPGHDLSVLRLWRQARRQG